MSNHSCEPNAEIKFKNNNNILTMVALTDINQNDEITISYLDECDLLRSRHSRQKILQANYLFNCECERCVEELKEQEDVTSEEEEEEDDEIEDEEEDEDELMEN
jgi:SET and MYND domain-containing protein 5